MIILFPFHGSFSRHAKVSKFPLVIWLNENVHVAWAVLHATRIYPELRILREIPFYPLKERRIRIVSVIRVC